MTDPDTIPTQSCAVIDSSVLFAMGGPDNEKYQAFQRFVTRQQITVLVPEHVARELGESPAEYAYQRDRLRAAQEAGWLEPGHVDFQMPGVSRVVDRTRKRMAKRSAEDITEDEIEKADTVRAGYQCVTDSEDHVTVFVSDTLAATAIRDVLSVSEFAGDVRVVDGRSFLDTLSD